MHLTPVKSNFSQRLITVLIPIISNPILTHPVFEASERAPVAYGVTQVISYVVIVYRVAESFHDAVLVNSKFVE